jgi:GT2 family glycosyltransferase
MPHERVSVVVLTHNRPLELRRTLNMLSALPVAPRVIVVDNGSRAGLVREVLDDFPSVELVRCERNEGAAGRNLGVARVSTPFVAFCDDDTWWAPGALQRAADLLDAHPRLAVISARVVVGPEERTDPTCDHMAASPLGREHLPGPRLIAFMAGAAVMRTQAYCEVGGYEPRLFLGAEELLMGLELAARGWEMAYVSEIVTHHHPSPTSRDPRSRQVMAARNKIWIAWRCLPWRMAWSRAHQLWRESARQGIAGEVLIQALRGLPWAWTHRQVIPERVQAMYSLVYDEGPCRTDCTPRRATA